VADVFEVAQILVSHALRVYGEHVALIAYYGSYAKGLASPTSDLDMFYIPDDGRAKSLSIAFVLDGLPYDFWPVSWKMAEEIANARSHRPWADSASLIADAKVLYHRSQADLERFGALQARIAELIAPESRGIMVVRALDAFKMTLFQLGQMRLAAESDDVAGLRWAGHKLASNAVNCLALVNQTYFSKGWGANLAQVLELAQSPPDLEEMLKAIMLPQSPEDLLAQAERLATEVRRVLRSAQLSVAVKSDASDAFNEFYFFMVEYVSKILSACERRDTVAAASAAFHLQEEICQLMNKVDRGFYGTDFNLLGEYSSGYREAGFPDLLEPASRGDLPALAAQARRLDEHVRTWFGNHSIDLNVFENPADLQRFLDQSDSA